MGSFMIMKVRKEIAGFHLGTSAMESNDADNNNLQGLIKKCTYGE